MTQPAAFSSTFFYDLLTAVTDVAQIGVAFENQVSVVNVPAWAVVSAWNGTTGTYTSPVEAGTGRFFTVVLNKLSTTHLECQVKNEGGTIISDRSMQIDASVNVDIYTGDHHFAISAQNVTPEAMGGGLLDVSPQPQSAIANHVTGWGTRNSTATADGLNTSSYYALEDNGSPTYGQRLVTETTGAFGTIPMFDAANFSVHQIPRLAATQSSVNRRIGKLYQMYLCDSSFPISSDITIPIDTGVTAVFRVLGRTVGASYLLVAMRKA